MGTGKRSSRQDEPSSKRRRNGHNRDVNGKGKAKGKGKERQIESRKKADVVTIEEEGSEEEEEDDGLELDENQTQPGPSKPSFKDRLAQNMHSSPRFSKGFKGKVKSSNSTSMVRIYSILGAGLIRERSPVTDLLFPTHVHPDGSP